MLRVLFHLLKEPAFNQLRTQEQLGYIVSSSLSPINKILGGKFVIQSSKFGPEYLESRINNFLAGTLEKGGFSQDQVEAVAKSQI